MGILTRFLNSDQHERRGWNLTMGELDAMMDTAAMGGAASATGRIVTPDTALQLTAVYACVRVIAETVASLPLIVYRRLPDGGKARATDHPLYSLLHDFPNPEMTRMELWEALIAHIALRGNAYCEMQINTYTGDVVALWPLRPDRMTVGRTAGRLLYTYRLGDGTEKVFTQSQILHLRGLGTNGLTGYSVIELNREAVGLGMATEEYGARWFGNGARPGAVLQHPGVLSDDAHRHLRDSWEQRHAGLSNAQRVAILEEGMTLATIGVPPDDSQFLETRKFQVSEIARMFRVPPHMIADLERATFSNIEHQAIDFVVHTVRPWVERIEQRLESSLISPAERGTVFIEHVIDGLLRGDTASRYQAYSIGRQWGWLSADDIRGIENMNPLPDGQGQIYLQPLNMVPAGSESPGPEEPPAQDEPPAQEERALPAHETAVSRVDVQLRSAASRRRLATSYKRTLNHVAQRVVNREVNDIRNAARRFFGNGVSNLPGFEEWYKSFDAEHRAFVLRYLDPPLRTYSETVAAEVERETAKDVAGEDIDKFVTDYVAGRTNQWMANLQRAVKAATKRPPDAPQTMEPWTPLDAIEEEMDDRTAKQAESFAEEESFRASNAIAIAMYTILGIQSKVWSAAGGDTCPFCSQLDGMVVEMSKTFLAAGQPLESGHPDMQAFVSASNIGHPPIHAGCSCVILAA